MRRVSRLFMGLGLVLVVCAVLALGSRVSSYGQSTGCPGCTEGFVSSNDIVGGNECAHGPEYDSDCGDSPDCCEVTEEGCTGADGECSCFSCGNADECEGEIEVYLAWCEMSGTGECANGGTGDYGVVRREADAEFAEDVATCDYGSEFEEATACGGSEPSFAYACVAPSGTCVTVGDWAEESGTRPACE